MLSLAVAGANYPNKRGPTRLFEIAVCVPGEPVQLLPEPKNPADGNAIMIVSERGVLMGYVPAERTTIIHHAWRAAHDVKAIFQKKIDGGALIRVGIGIEPILPAERAREPIAESGVDPGGEFYPDYIPPDE